MVPGLVSVMMPAYNAARFIAEAIESVLAQTYQQWELLVVNDGSRDDTADIAGSYSDPRVRLINKENGGEASARNVALENSRGEFIAYLDADDVWLPHHLQVTVDFLLAHPEREAVYTDGLHYDPQGNRLKPLSARRRGPFEGDIFSEVVRASDVFGPPICVVLRHGLVAEHQLRYDTRIVIGPDWDFFTRYCQVASFGYVDDQTCLYRVHETNITVQVDMKRRAGYLALCREKATQLERFGELPLAVKTAVYDDLLVYLTIDQPERQNTIIQTPLFMALPAPERAWLLRRMASQALLHTDNFSFVQEWLRQARLLNPQDWNARLMAAVCAISPGFGRSLLRLRRKLNPEKPPVSPFADLVSSHP